MDLTSGLSLYCYTLPVGSPPVVVEYGRAVEQLAFTSLAPGGYGQLDATLRVPNVALPRPELALFARVALMGHGENGQQRALFIGEMMAPEVGYAQGSGEYLKISALGIGNALRDDPRTLTYTLQTAQAMGTAQITLRSAYLPMSQDTSLIFPDNPAGTYSPSYIYRTAEEVIADVAILAGDYQWGTWAHANQTDAAGFPLGQLSVQIRDPNTQHYTASIKAKDVVSWRITPVSDRAYNAISLDYYDVSQNPPVGTYNISDARLNGDGSQGTAPFRRRKYAQDFSGTTTVTKAQAQAIANTYLAIMKNVTNKVEIVLKAARNPQGMEIPLWAVQADRNIFVPEMSVRGQQLPTGPVAGVNMFYIVSCQYQEASNGEATLTLECDNYFDRTQRLVARLQQWADREARDNRTTGLIQAAGANIYAGCGNTWTATGAAQTFRVWVPFGTTTATAPTSITLTNDISSLNTSGSATVDSITVNGFRLNVKSAAAGLVEWYGHYLTVGL